MNKAFQVFVKPGAGREDAGRAARMQPFGPRFASAPAANAHMKAMKQAPRFSEGRVEVRRVA